MVYTTSKVDGVCLSCSISCSLTLRLYHHRNYAMYIDHLRLLVLQSLDNPNGWPNCNCIIFVKKKRRMLISNSWLPTRDIKRSGQKQDFRFTSCTKSIAGCSLKHKSQITNRAYISGSFTWPLFFEISRIAAGGIQSNMKTPRDSQTPRNWLLELLIIDLL